MADRPPALTAEVFAGGERRNFLFTLAALRDGALRLSKCFRRTGKEMAYTMTSLSNVCRGIRIVFLGAAAPRGCLAAARPRYAGRMD